MRRTVSVAALIAGLSGTALAGPASAATADPAAGAFTVAVAFPTAVFDDVGRQACRVSVDGTLTFTGTLTGAATGTISALVLAPCSEAQSTPPGTARDVFRFRGVFSGTVDGAPTTGALTYAGVTRVGGAIDATVRLSGPTRAALRAEAAAGVGGTYTGIVA
jgi:energy-converting hydrogenase Eha subunit A